MNAEILRRFVLQARVDPRSALTKMMELTKRSDHIFVFLLEDRVSRLDEQAEEERGIASAVRRSLLTNPCGEIGRRPTG